MVNRLKLIRNVGQFDSVNSVAHIDLPRLSLVYAENGRGKTTLAAILRSLSTGDGAFNSERKRFNAQHDPHIVLECPGGAQPVTFQNGTWSRTFPSVRIFDDLFVDTNIYSGLSVDPQHRQNLNHLIIGAMGIGLNQTLQQHVDRIEVHNTTLRAKSNVVTAIERGGLSVDQFCDLTLQQNLDQAIQETERSLAAAKDQDKVLQTGLFLPIELPEFDHDAIETLLARDLPSLEQQAADQVAAHISHIGANAESWVSEGLQRIPASDSDSSICPFCAQDLRHSTIIQHYRSYFSQAYEMFKSEIATFLERTRRKHEGEAVSSFERAIRVWSERRGFWHTFNDVPDVQVDTAAIGFAWRAARERVIALLQAKQARPLEKLSLTPEVKAAIAAYDVYREEVSGLSQALTEVNSQLEIVKERAAAGNFSALANDLARLKATRTRFEPTAIAACDDYLAEKTAKTATEVARDQARAALNQYQASVYPQYAAAINAYLQTFGAGFRISDMDAVTNRGGAACNYKVVINGAPVSIASAVTQGSPSFRNTLSAGDRNTLALAFFLAAIDKSPDIASLVVVIDDPMTSLDEHRSLTTVQEIRRLSQRVSKVIVLSHSKPFLCNIWAKYDQQQRVALQVSRAQNGSTLAPWDINQDCVTEYDRRHAMIRNYVCGTGGLAPRGVAEVLRPLLEGFVRVAYCEHFPPSSKIGQFRDFCRQKLNTGNQILDSADVDELGDLLEYAKYHHDTNAAWETEEVNDGQLVQFAQRTLAFVRR